MLPFEDALPFESALPFETDAQPIKDPRYAAYRKEAERAALQPQIPTESDPQGKRRPKIKTEAEWKSDMDRTMLDDLAGIIEGPLSIAAKLPATLAAGIGAPYALLRGKRGKELEQTLAQISSGPSWTDSQTDRGQKVAQNISEFLQPFGLSPYANIGALGARGNVLGRPKILDVDVGKAIKDKIQQGQNVDKPAATIPEATAIPPAVDPGNIAMRNIAEQQLKDWTEPLPQEPRSAMPDIVAQAERARFEKVQQELAARQAALEADVAKQAGLDRNAAARARQESAPTGYAEWVEAQRMRANERIPGNNEALPFETSPLVDSNFIKQGDPYVVPDPFKDATHRPGGPYNGGIDFNEPLQADLVSKAEGTTPWPIEPKDPMQVAREMTSGTELARKRPLLNSGPAGKQRGAIDFRGAEDLLYRLISLERLPNKPIITDAMIRQVVGQQDIPQADKQLLLNAYNSVAQNGQASNTALIRAVRDNQNKYSLSNNESLAYAEYGVENLGYDTPNTRQNLNWTPEGEVEVAPDMRGTVRATTNIWNLDQPTSAGNHFQEPNYFGHTRNFVDENGVRHVVEIQSDLIQKLGKTLSDAEIQQLDITIKNLDEQLEVFQKYRNDGQVPNNLMAQTMLSNFQDVVRELKKLNPDIEYIFGDTIHEALLRINTDISVDRIIHNFDKFEEAAKRRNKNGTWPLGTIELRPYGTDSTPVNVSNVRLVRAIEGALYDYSRRLDLLYDEHSAKLKANEDAKKLDFVKPMSKDWAVRLIREELGSAARKGESIVRFADADGVAKVEGWPDGYAAAKDEVKYLQRVAKEELQEFNEWQYVVENNGDTIKESYPDSLKIAHRNAYPGTTLLDAWIINEAKGQIDWLQPRLETYAQRIKDAQHRVKTIESGAEPRFNKQHQGIYDRYKKTVEPYLESIGAKRVEDGKGNTWLETPVEPHRARPIMFGQRGMLNFDAFSEPIKRLASLAKDSPEVIAAQKRVKVESILAGIDSYRANITTPEQVIALAPKAKDITKLQKFNTNWRPGLRINTINTNNPLLKFANHVIHNAWTQADNLARVWITDNKTGIGPKWRELKNNEKIEVHELLQAGDRAQRRFTAEELRANNFTENQIAFIQKFYEMDDLKYQVWNEKRMENGEEPIRYREGHFPGNFKGDYKTLVFDKEGKIIGYIGTDTRFGHNKALAAVKEKFPDATFSRMTRSKLGGYGNRSDMFSGMNDLIAVLAKNDPRIAEIHAAVQQAIVRRADGTFGADVHALDKKGIWGNEGNKPWSKDKLGDANEAMKAFFEYWEEGMISHHMMPAEAQLKALVKNPELSHMPRAAAYLDDYVNNITGRSIGEVGSALNTLIDAPMKLAGLGPSVTRQGVNQFTKRMGQWTQGFANIPYTVMQFTQYAQTGVPVFIKAAGGDMMKVGRAVELAGADAITLMKEKLAGVESLDPTHRMMFDYAESKGMLQFSEFEEVSHIAQGDFARNFDKLVDYNRSIGEKSTRPLTFFTLVRLLEDTGLPKQEMLETAYNMTQDAMVDYSSRERAPMFKNLGVLGQTAGNLQQFSLTYLDQMGRWIKDANPKMLGGKGNPGPLIAGTTILLAMAGLQGLPFYNTIDDLVELITDKFFGEKKNISTLVMQSPYEWAKSDWLQYGALSTGTGLNVTGRLGMADVAPESFMDAVSPYASTVGRMATTAYDAFKNPDDVSFATAARQWAPSSIRGLIENKYLTDDTGVTVNPKGQKDYPRTPFDMEARKWSMTSLEEAKAKDKLYTKQKSLQADTEAVTKIGDKISRRSRLSSDYTRDKLESDLAEYTARGGDAKQLVNKIIKDYEEAAKTSKMRIEGTTLKNIQQLRRWMKINEE